MEFLLIIHIYIRLHRSSSTAEWSSTNRSRRNAIKQINFSVAYMFALQMQWNHTFSDLCDKGFCCSLPNYLSVKQKCYTVCVFIFPKFLEETHTFGMQFNACTQYTGSRKISGPLSNLSIHLYYFFIITHVHRLNWKFNVYIMIYFYLLCMRSALQP